MTDLTIMGNLDDITLRVRKAKALLSSLDVETDGVPNATLIRMSCSQEEQDVIFDTIESRKIIQHINNAEKTSVLFRKITNLGRWQ